MATPANKAAHRYLVPRRRGTRRVGLRRDLGRAIEPADALGLAYGDTDRHEDDDWLREGIDHNKGRRGRFVYAQTPGIFEALNGVFGIENLPRRMP